MAKNSDIEITVKVNLSFWDALKLRLAGLSKCFETAPAKSENAIEFTRDELAWMYALFALDQATDGPGQNHPETAKAIIKKLRDALDADCQRGE